MNHILVQQASIIHKFVEKEGANNKTRLQSTIKLFQSTAKILENTGSQMLQSRNEFLTSVQSLQPDSSCLSELTSYCQQLLKTFAKVFQSMGKDIQTQLASPLQLFLCELQINNKKFLQSSIQITDEIKSNLKRLDKVEKAFTEKRSTMMKKNSMFKSQQIKYKGQVISTNEMWAAIQYRYTKLLEDFDCGNEVRCQTLKRQLVAFARVMNRLPQSEEVEARLKGFEKAQYVQYILEEEIVAEIQQGFGRSQLLRPLRMFQSLKLRYLVGDGDMQQRLKEVEAFSQGYLVKQASEVSPKGRALVLQSPQLSEYFLSCLCCRLHTEKILPKDKYNDLLAIAKCIFVEAMQLPDNAMTLYGLLYLSIRVSNQGVTMIKQFAKYADFWQLDSRWDQIYNKVYQHLTKSTRSSRSCKPTSTPSTSFLRPTATTTPQLHTKYQSLKQLNIHLTQLELNSDFTINYISKKCKELKLLPSQLETLLMYQEQAKRNSLAHLYFSSKATAERRAEKVHRAAAQGMLYAVRKSLKYLDILRDRLGALRLVCRAWDEGLNRHIYKRYLDDANLNIIDKMRARLYKAVVPQAYTFSVYKRMLAEVPEDFPFSQQINMDVRRSLNKKPQLRNSLKSMLTVFAFYNEKIGYVQGMNYIGESVLKLSLPPQSSYCVLEYLLRTYFSSLFHGQLDNLKVKIYQFSRLMEKYLPNLHKHLENEKIQPQHFLVPWIVTLWGEMQGDIVWLMWDGFLLTGWKWWIRVCLWLLSIFEADLLEMSFEEILKFFSDLPSNAFFKCKFNDYFVYALSPLKIKDEINGFKVTNRMLDILEGEYLRTRKKYGEIGGVVGGKE